MFFFILRKMPFLFFILAMTLSVLTLNTGGCSAQTQNASLKVYVEQITFNPDLVLLQETYDLKENSSCWSVWPHTPFCSSGKTRGSGVTSLINQSKIDILKTTSIYDGYILYNELCYNNSTFHVYNVLIPQSDRNAILALTALDNHISDCSNGTIVIGGDFNCTENPSLDRLCMLTERRPLVVKALKNVMNKLSLCDVWRRLNPNKHNYTWQRNNPATKQGVSKSRIDRFYVPSCIISSINVCKIIPCSLSDHSAVLLQLSSLKQTQRGGAYWHFNNSLLEDVNYKEIIQLFWLDWRARKGDFPNLASWWDFGKIHIKSLTQMYSSKIIKQKRSALLEINKEIERLQSAPDFTLHIKKALDEQKCALNSLLRNEARGALVRSRFKYINETDSCSSFFFSLEKSNSQSKNISRVRLSTGDISDDPVEIKKHVRGFYKSLYSKTKTDKTALINISADLPKLESSTSEDLDSPPTVEELDNAVKQLGKNKSPGSDGLTSEFFQVFWPLLRNDYLSVILSSLKSNSLPPSFRRAIITLLPKKGDLADISNWRPVSLLNTDYKIFAKLLAGRLKQCIADVIHKDQSYCVPGRSIYDNVNLIRDAIFYANIENIPLAILNLDQKKAFDNVDHDYLFEIMDVMGFGHSFISYIKSLYEGAESLIKVSGSLTLPFSFEKGIRQGCPLSGLLYTIAIEPLLSALRKTLPNHALRAPRNDQFCIVSAYADDVTIFITSNDGFKLVEEAYTTFSRASAACLNTKKSQGLWVGQWIGRADSPLNFSWNSEGLPFLGVHLGNTPNYLKQNWLKCKEKLTKTLLSWSRLSNTMSYKGKVIIANQLAASKIFHFLAVLSPPESVLNELQNLLVEFVWSGKRHWLKKETLYDQPDNGGLGLACLKARILSFRFVLIQRFLKLIPHPAYYFMGHFLRQYCKLGFDYQLFHVQTDTKFYTSVPVFYSEILQAWTMSGARIKIQPNSLSQILNLPLICDTLLEAIDVNDFLPTRLMACGVKLIRDMFDPVSGQWAAAHSLQESRQGLRASLRLIENELHILKSALCETFPILFRVNGCHLSDNVDLRAVPLSPNTPVEFILPSSENGLIASSKTIYKIFNKELNNALSSSDSHWHNIGYLDSSTKVNWILIYQLPISKKEGDVQFRLNHNFLPSLDVLHHLNQNISSSCGWCGEKGTIEHLFIRCSAIQPALDLLYELLENLLPFVKLTFDMYWVLIPHAKGRCREAVRLANFLIISFKNVIYNLYRSSMFSDPLIVFIQRLKSRILYEFHYYKLCYNLDSFSRKWSINETLFTANEEMITWLI